MSILSDKEILTRCQEDDMISPFFDDLVNKDKNGDKIISYGLSSYGYDVRVGNKFAIFDPHLTPNTVIDPKKFMAADIYKSVEADYCIIPANGFVLGHTIETFKVPRDILIVCVGKSTYARCGIIVNVTPIEPEFEGQVVLEFSNTTSLPVKLYANEGASQFMFFKADQVCNVSYKDRKGKYFGQSGITDPKI
jgi:dCTP deaminase